MLALFAKPKQLTTQLVVWVAVFAVLTMPCMVTAVTTIQNDISVNTNGTGEAKASIMTSVNGTLVTNERVSTRSGETLNLQSNFSTTTKRHTTMEQKNGNITMDETALRQKLQALLSLLTHYVSLLSARS